MFLFRYHTCTVDMIADDKVSCTVKFDNSGSVDVVKVGIVYIHSRNILFKSLFKNVHSLSWSSFEVWILFVFSYKQLSSLEPIEEEVKLPQGTIIVSSTQNKSNKITR